MLPRCAGKSERRGARLGVRSIRRSPSLSLYLSLSLALCTGPGHVRLGQRCAPLPGIWLLRRAARERRARDLGIATRHGSGWPLPPVLAPEKKRLVRQGACHLHWPQAPPCPPSLSSSLGLLLRDHSKGTIEQLRAASGGFKQLRALPLQGAITRPAPSPQNGAPSACARR
eukprot:10318149-Alexandrium_andersonii.AAC.1